jgi:hypothetical protein
MFDKIANNNTNYSVDKPQPAQYRNKKEATRRNLKTGVRDKHRNVVTWYRLMGFQYISNQPILSLSVYVILNTENGACNMHDYPIIQIEKGNML